MSQPSACFPHPFVRGFAVFSFVVLMMCGVLAPNRLGQSPQASSKVKVPVLERIHRSPRIAHSLGSPGPFTRSDESNLTVNPRAALSFSSPTSFSVGSDPRAVAVGDFNLDGKPDLAAAVAGSNVAAVLIGNGAGSFGTATTFGVGMQPRGVAVGDFNLDGKPDLAVANGSSSNVSILLGNGAGAFGAATNFPVSVGPIAVAVGDFNLDGKPDLATANFDNNNVSIILGNGAGAFGAPSNIGVPNEPASVAVGDFNLDGRPDLVVPRRGSNAVAVLIGNGAGGFAGPSNFTVGNGPGSVAVGDFNLDGKPDLAVSNVLSNTVSVLIGNGAGSFGAATNLAVGSVPAAVVVGDYNLDGKPDLAVTNELANNVSILAGNGTGAFGAATNFSSAGDPFAAAGGDFNLDGKSDLAVVNNFLGTVSVLLNQSDQAPCATVNFDGPNNLTAPTTLRHMISDDFNRDGKIDLVTESDFNQLMTIFLGNGDGTFGAGSTVSNAYFFTSAASGDFNRDGKPDIVVAPMSVTTAGVFLGNGNGTFGAPVTPTTAFGPKAVAVADFNRDGKLDIATANSGFSNVSIILGNGDGTFGGNSDFNIGSNPVWIDTGDFNLDGKPDVVTANGNNNISVFLGDGTGGLGAPTQFATGAAGGNLQNVMTADLNLDGKPDLVTVSREFPGKASVLFGNGTGGFSAPTVLSTPNGPWRSAVADFNRDGKPDLAVSSAFLAGVSIFFGNGAGGFSARSDYSSGTGAVGLVGRDLNRDGKPDLAIGENNIGAVAIRLNTCGVGAPTAVVSGGGTICAGSSGTVTVSVSGGSPPYTVTLTNGGGTMSGNTPLIFTVSPSSTTTYGFQSGTDSASVAITGSGTATVTVNQPPTTANAGPDQTLCASSPTATLAANNPATGTGAWSVVTAPGGGSTSSSQFSNPASRTSTFTPSPVVAGNYTLRWTISNSPCTASTDDVVITYRSVTTSNAGSDQTLCVSSPAATLAANNPANGTGAWSVVTAPGGGSTSTSQFSSTSNPTATFTPSPATVGNYTLRWTISNSPCTASTDDVVITYNAVPTTSNAGPDQTLCTTSPTATLAANGPSSGTGAWSVVTAPGGGSTSSSQFSNTASPTSTFTPNPVLSGTFTLRWTISNSPCTASTDDVLIVYNAASPTSNAGPDQTLCVTSTATLAANTPSVGTPSWSVVSGPSTLLSQFSGTSSPTATFTPAGGAGTYTLRWTITPSAPCTPSTDDVVLTFVATPTTSSAGADQTICVNGSATLAANSPSMGTGTWSVVSGPSTSTAQFSGTSSPTATFTPAGGAGTYTLRWTISNPPCAPSTDDVVITVNAQATTSNAGPDQTPCVTSSATLAANAPTVGTGAWSVVSGPSTSSSQFSNTSSPTATFTPAGGAGSYILRWTITPAAPCPASTDDVTLTFVATPTASNAGPDQTLCATTPATLAANTPLVGSGSWSVVTGPSGSSSQFSGTTSPTATFTPAGGAGTYVLRWTISNAPCPDSTDDVNVTFTAPPTPADAGADQTLCLTSSATLAAGSPAVGTGAWSVLSGPSASNSQFSNASSPTGTFTPAGGAGTYVLRWTTSNPPCSDSFDDVAITFNATPTPADAGADQTLCLATPVSLAANSPLVGGGSWTVASGPNASGTQFSNVASPTATFTPAGGAGSYVLRWTISNPPCSPSSDDVTIVYNAPPSTANAGSDQTLCVTGAATLAANIPGIGTGQWTVGSGPSTIASQFSNVNSPTATFTPAGGQGVYVLRWTITSDAPCPPSFDDVAVTFNAVPTTSNAGADQTICDGSGTTLGANVPSVGTGAWSVAAGPSTSGAQFSNSNSPNSVFTPAGGPGFYTLQWTISNAPCATSSDTVSIFVGPATPPANAGSDQTLCVTTPAELGASFPQVGTGAWSVANGPNTSPSQFGNVGNSGTTFTPAGGAGTYTLRWTVTNPPCPPSFDTVAVTFTPLPTPASAGPDFTICLPLSGTLSANTPTVGAGQWTVDSGPNTDNSQFSNVNAPNGVFTPAGGPGAYVLRWTVTPAGPCASSSDTVTVTASNSCAELGAVYVADTQNHRIQRFDGSTWQVLCGNGSPGTATNRCNLPKAVAASTDGSRIYVADTGNNRVTFSTDGGGTWAVLAANGAGLTQIRGPQALAVDMAGNLYVADALSERVVRFDGGLPGTSVVLASSGTGAGQVKGPRGLAIDGAGNLYVTDRVMHRVLRISNAGATTVANTGIAVVSGQGLTLSQVNGPEGIAVDGTGNVYVADTLNERVIQFPGGTAPGIVMTDGAGTTLGKVNRPEGVAVTKFIAGPFAGQTFLIVGDTMNNRIQGRPLGNPTWQLVGTPNNVGSGVGQFRMPSKIR